MYVRGKGKNHENTRADLEAMGIRPELYAREIDTRKDIPVVATTL
jgi:hypothetical protein